MPSQATFNGSGDMGSDSANEQKRFSVPLASVAKSTQKLHVSNIPIGMEESGLRHIFSQFGEISSVYLKNTQNGQSRGGYAWAFVTFDNPLAASTAMERVNMNNTFGLHVKLAMSEQEKAIKKMTEHEKELLILDQQKRLEAFEKTKGIGQQNYPVEEVLGPMEGKAAQLKECAQLRAQPRPTHSFLEFNKNTEVSDFSPYENGYREDVKKQNISLSNVEESDLKPFVFNGRTLPCMAPHVPLEERKICGNLRCENIGQVRCARCKLWYCSQKCQINDWQRHKPDCEAPPALEKPDGTPYRLPSHNLRLASSSAAFGDTSAPKSLQKNNKIESHIDLELEDINRVIPKTSCSKLNDIQSSHAVRTTDVPVDQKERSNSTSGSNIIAKLSNYDQHIYAKTVLDSAKKGDTIQIIANLESTSDEKLQPTSCPAVFSATCFLDQDADLPVLDYVLGSLQDKAQLDGLTNLDKIESKELSRCEGKVMITYDEAENAYSRYLCLNQDIKENVATLYSIDSPKQLSKVSFSKIKLADSEAYSHPAVGFHFFAIGTMSQSIRQRVLQVALNESFEARVLFIKFFGDGRLKHMTVALLDTDKSTIITYKVTPYFMNEKVANLINVDCTYKANVVENAKLLLNEHVHGLWDATLKFSKWTDLLLVMRVPDIERRKKLQAELKQICHNAPPIAAKNEVDIEKLKGHLVACQFSRDGCYYRALVTGVKPDKARLQFIDFGNVEVEEWSNVLEIPDFASNSDNYPKFVNTIRLDSMPNAMEFTNDEKMKSRLAQLEPVFESLLQITKICDEQGISVPSSSAGNLKYVLLHPNGKTIQNIIQDKMNEKDDNASKGDVQGGTIEGMFDYNKCHFAEIQYDEKCKDNPSQDVIILNAESPTEIFVCPTNQIGLAEDLSDQVRAYVAAVGDNYLGAAPVPNHLCIAKSEEDDQWYRAVCCKELGDDIYELMFVDYGNVEKVPRKHIMHMTDEIMQTPILATHCVLEGFEDATKRESYQKMFADEIKKQLPAFEETKIVVLNKLRNTSTYIVRIPSIEKSINSNLIIKNDNSNEQDDSASSRSVQERKIEAMFDYNKCRFTDLKYDENCKDSPAQDVIILHAESPTQIFVCPTNQIDLVEELSEQVRTYVATVVDKYVGTAPVSNHLYIAKSEEDGLWYRAVCCKEVGDDIYELRFVDYGNVEKVPKKHIMHITHEIMQTPLLANHCVLEGFENSTERDSDQKMSPVKIAELLPAFEETKILVSKKLPNTSTYVVKIPSIDKSINPNLSIKNEKINEKQDNVNKADVPGGKIEGMFEYNKCNFTEIKYDEKCKDSTELDVMILYAESPSRIFVCPTNQIDLVEDLSAQVSAYAATVGENYLGVAPVPNYLCIAKSEEDDQWYRALCCKELGNDTYELMFVDYGNVEKVPRKHIMRMTEEIMQIPLLANHCVLEGFEDVTKKDSYQKMFADEIPRLLPSFEETKIVVSNKLPNTSTYIVKIPSIAKSINPNILIKREKETNNGDADLTKECDAEVVKICSNISKELTSDQSKKELHEKLEQEAAKRQADEAKRKELEEKIKKMQEMLANM